MAAGTLEGVALPLVDILLNEAEGYVLDKLRGAKYQLTELTTKTAQVGQGSGGGGLK